MGMNCLNVLVITLLPLLFLPVLASVFLFDKVVMSRLNLTICWELCNNDQQRANHDGSPSETIRQTSQVKPILPSRQTKAT